MSLQSFTNRFTKKPIATRTRTEKPQVTQIYKVDAEELKSLFDSSEMSQTEQVSRLEQQYKGVHGVLQSLQSEASTGIMGDERDLHRRQTFFGENTKPRPQYPPFINSIKDALEERILQCVAGLAVLSLITGMIQDWRTGWIEGVSILFALVLLVLITSWNDWLKDRQFVKLADHARDEEVTVVRGKLGAMQQINIWSLVVGDVVILNAGDKVPADCIVISSSNLEVEEEGAGTLQKDEKHAPFLRADSFILKGSVRAVVVCVGENSTRGAEAKPIELSENTPLQQKLGNLSQSFTFIGLWAAVIIFVTSTVILFIQTGVDSDVGGSIFAKKCVQNFILAFIIILVAIPEGLPMTVGISLAYSVDNMFNKENILIRELDSIEKMGEVTEFVLGKTGTLTTEEMTITNFFAQDSLIKNNRKDTLVNCSISAEVLELVKESIIYNNQCHIEMNENAFYIPVGNGTEVSLLKWLQRAEIPVHALIKNKETQLRASFPFSSEEKYSIAVMENEEKVRIYLKGAPEEVLKKCSLKFHANGTQVELEETDRQYILGDIASKTFAKKDGLRVIALSYYDMDLEVFNNIKQETNNFANPSDFEQILDLHTFIGLIALKDPLRDGVKNTIDKAIQEGGVNVRLVSADHLETAKCYAVDAGILAKDSYNDFAQEGNAYAMNADDFIEQVGIRQYQDERDQYVIGPENQQRFQQLMDTLVVIGRAKPMHKQVVANGLRAMRKKVAVIGEGITDLKAFENADVSFAMGSGKSMARNRSSMVLTDNNFESCIKAILRGRNIYSNIKKFLQFQITVNFSILVCILISVLYLTESPFNAVMLIWINLIMDVLAALALATAPPLERVITEPAITEGVQILQPVIWRQIYGITVWNILVMSLVIFLGEPLFGLSYQASDQANTTLAKRQHFTIIFDTFVFLQMFNQINCRVVGPRDFNVFTSFFNNWIFIFVIGLIFAVQYYASTEQGFSLAWMFQTAEIDRQTFWTTVFYGATTILVSFVLKLSPKEWMEKVPIKIDENEALGADSKIVSIYEKQTKKQVNVSINAAGNDDDDYQVQP